MDDTPCILSSLVTQRKIIHVDMDAFFAAVEQRDQPEYEGQPLIVGGKPGSRGVVAACSYEARKFGIHSAMSCAKAYRLCPRAIFVPPRFDAYRKVSSQLHEIFRDYTQEIEPLSLDEAYLDVSNCSKFSGSATLIAKDIRQKIFDKTGLTASAGISYNKFLAKIASDMNKPNGQAVVRPADGEAFVAKLPIGGFYGVGKVTEGKMHSIGINTGADLRKFSVDELKIHFGKAAEYYYSVARGIDNRPVQNSRERKSIGAETTFAEDLIDSTEMLIQLHRLSERVMATLDKKHMTARTVTIKVKFDDFRQVTRSHTFEDAYINKDLVKKWIPVLLEKTVAGEKPVRLLGISLSSLNDGAKSTEQFSLL